MVKNHDQREFSQFSFVRQKSMVYPMLYIPIKSLSYSRYFRLNSISPNIISGRQRAAAERTWTRAGYGCGGHREHC